MGEDILLMENILQVILMIIMTSIIRFIDPKIDEIDLLLRFRQFW